MIHAAVDSALLNLSFPYIEHIWGNEFRLQLLAKLQHGVTVEPLMG